MAKGWSIDVFGAMFEGYLEGGTHRGPGEVEGRGKRGRRAGIRQVAVLVDGSTAIGRGVIRGISQYNREHGRWVIAFHPFVMGREIPEWLMQWRGHGILACVETVEVGEMLERSGLPVVNVGGGVQMFSQVVVDDWALGVLAAEHFQDRGLRHFGVCDVDAGRAGAFREVTRPMGSCEVFDWKTMKEAGTWEWEQEGLAGWVKRLKRPVGVLAGDDAMGLRLLEACRRCGCVVPDDVSVLTVGNDEVLCELAVPRLSSVDLNGERMGMEAAGRLDVLMRTRKGVEGAVRVEPRGVVVRGSTDMVASGDGAVDRAVRFIRERGGGGIGVAEVVEHVGMGRLAMQRRMKKMLGRTIHEEIDRARVGRVKEMLLRPEMTIKQVARAAGFSSVQYMTRVFREAVGETPGRWRGR